MSPDTASGSRMQGYAEEVEADERDERGVSRSSRERRRRERAKARADKMFDAQFAPSERAEGAVAAAEGAPRAALYEGKMGSSHRKSTRMQRTAADDASRGIASSVGSRVAGLFSGLSITPRSLKIATAVFCVLLTAVFLYGPAKECYQAQREHDRLAVEYSTIEKRNDVLDAQNDILASDAGMEDAVREKYGYVKNGEQTAVVTGLSENATDTSRDSENIEANVLSSSVKAPEEWYTPLLDAFFGVE